MSDLIERLRGLGAEKRPHIGDEAADEIESLTALVAELGAGLCEAMDWNWLDDGAEEDIPCFNKLQALAKLREKDDE
jgi:hypothetical protein